METRKYAFELYDYALKKGSELHYEELEVGPVHDKTFTQRVVLNGNVYPDGVGKTKKEAKSNAAKNALQNLLEHKHQDTAADEKYNCTLGQQKEDLNINVSDFCNKIRRLSVNPQLYKDQRRQRETNFIGIVDHYCQKTKRCYSFIEEKRCGPAHDPQFFYKLMIDKKEYPVGEGKTAKEAKQNAAQLAWSAVQEQSDFDSKVSVKSTMSEDGAPPRFPAQLNTQESHESSSQSMPIGTGGSIIFPDTSNPSEAQDAVEDQNMEESQSETSINSRFTTDFDPMECLGRGAFGVVYKARHKLLRMDYAVKVVCGEEKSLREMGTLSELLHCNIVRYYTFWMEDSGYQGNSESTDGSASSSSSHTSNNSSAKYFYIQMELCNTKTLKEWIDEKNAEILQDSKRRKEGLSIAQQIVSGVEYIHSKKHIHRDLKPVNILFGLDGEVKIADFGLVTRDDDDDDDALMERTGQRGTTVYMAPEQKREKNYDRKVDIFALGLIYFELLWKLSTGHERAAVWDDARSQKLPEEFSLTFPQENQIIELMLHKKPEDRPEARKLKAEMEMCAQALNAQNMHQENATV
ncbi:interferon-induced, double-stranded RNA-activated protein kinase-like [Anoplopoma fimbria]|uniref:interferon-induced, double-stranded RNA-activated protein kinase-like n=1 Tax=Anoplopoma fimbria TaxID=229290 RepID=UPI0023ED85F3|nr:interferon-induced, double-stranded RNA-activated protein kinase-like [Anoplopoma fimbria]